LYQPLLLILLSLLGSLPAILFFVVYFPDRRPKRGQIVIVLFTSAIGAACVMSFYSGTFEMARFMLGLFMAIPTVLFFGRPMIFGRKAGYTQ